MDYLKGDLDAATYAQKVTAVSHTYYMCFIVSIYYSSRNHAYTLLPLALSASVQ
jgi:hypothetical protein